MPWQPCSHTALYVPGSWDGRADKRRRPGIQGHRCAHPSPAANPGPAADGREVPLDKQQRNTAHQAQRQSMQALGPLWTRATRPGRGGHWTQTTASLSPVLLRARKTRPKPTGSTTAPKCPRNIVVPLEAMPASRRLRCAPTGSDTWGNLRLGAEMTWSRLEHEPWFPKQPRPSREGRPRGLQQRGHAA